MYRSIKRHHIAVAHNAAENTCFSGQLTQINVLSYQPAKCSSPPKALWHRVNTGPRCLVRRWRCERI